MIKAIFAFIAIFFGVISGSILWIPILFLFPILTTNILVLFVTGAIWTLLWMFVINEFVENLRIKTFDFLINYFKGVSHG